MFQIQNMNKSLSIVYPDFFKRLNIKSGNHQSVEYIPEICLRVLYVLSYVISPTVIIHV